MTRCASFLLLLAAMHACAFAEKAPSSTKKRDIDFEVLSADGKPVAEAQVWVAMVANYNQDVKEDRLLASGRTDARGHFHGSFEAPGDGRYRFGTIIASKPEAGLSGGTSFLIPEEGPAFISAVGPASRERGSTLSMVPTAQCRVRLLKPDGSPASGVRMWVEQCEMPRDKRGFMYTVQYNVPRLREIGWGGTTDAEGRCSFLGLPKDAYLYLMHDAAGMAQLPGKYIGQYKESPRANDLESTCSLVAAGSLRGRLTLPDGSPVSGGSLSLLEMRPYQTAYGIQLQTGADGRFEISQIPPSKYQIRYRGPNRDEDRWMGDEKNELMVLAGQTTHAGDLALSPVAIVTAQVLDAETGEEIEKPIIYRLKGGTHQLSYRSQRSGSETHIAPGPRDAIPVQIAAGERKSIVFRLQRRKAGNSVAGTVLNAKGEPAPRAVVVVLGAQEDQRFITPLPVDEKGAFRVTVDNADRGLSVMAWDESSISEPTAVKVGSNVTLKLQDSGLASIQGRICDEQGKPIEGAQFQLSHDLYLLQNVMGGPLSHTVAVGKDGRFQTPRLPRAIREVTLFAYKEGYASAALRDQTLQPGQALEWNPVLKPAREFLAGIVVDKAGAPVPGVIVRVSGDGQPSGLKPITTGPDGRFRFEKLAAGQAYVEARQSSGDMARRVSLRPKIPQGDLRLVLPDANGRMSGVVVDHEGRPAPDAEINAISRGRKTTADQLGCFELGGLEVGWFTAIVTFRTATGQHIEKRFRLRTGMEKTRVEMPERTEEERLPLAEPLTLVGKPASEIHVTTWINTSPMETKAGGKVRILDFWGMECAPCLAGFPKVQKFWQEHGKDGIEVIAMGSGFYPEQEIREFLKRHADYGFPIAIGPESEKDWEDYDVRGVPTYIVIGKDGTILSTGHDWEEASTAALRAAGK